MDTGNNRLLQSLGMGLLGVGVFLLVFATSNPNAGAKPFALFGMAWFLIAAGTSYLPYIVIDVLVAFTGWWHQRAMDAHERNKASQELVAKAKALQFASTVPPMPGGQGTVIDAGEPYKAAWVAYWLAGLEYAEEVGGISFQRMGAFCGGDHKTWRDCFIMPLVREGYVAPVQARKETVFESGYSAERVRWTIEAGKTPDPLPFPPPKPFEQQSIETTAKSSGKIEGNRETA